ncbi:MAG: hypothetical protein NC929_01065, partial [Candidatus Omnitrophica bacterium]|nr:hypothetical protein [Candidatus Omnitrophota bacterium]
MSAEKLSIIEKLISGAQATTKETFEFANFNGDLIINPGYWLLKELSCDGYEGHIKAYGRLNLTRSPYRYNLQL